MFFDPSLTTVVHFVGYPTARPRRFHIHVAQTDSGWVANDLSVRDYLHQHHAAAREYERLKHWLTAMYTGDQPVHVFGKDAPVAQRQSSARTWAGGRNDVHQSILWLG